MKLELEGRRVLVTGASRGLGEALCRFFVGEGAQVVGIARDQERLAWLAENMSGQQKNSFRFLSCDLLAEAGPESAVEWLHTFWTGADVIVHNMGGTLGIRDAYASSADYRQVWQFNLGAAIELNNRLLPELERQGWGRVVHVSSSSSVKVDASLPYSIAKASLNAYVQGMGRMVANRGIVVSGVLPGPFQYENSQWDLREKNQPEAYRDFIANRMPSGRLGTPEDLVGIIGFLASPHARFFAGALVPVDGGMR